MSQHKAYFLDSCARNSTALWTDHRDVEIITNSVPWWHLHEARYDLAYVRAVLKRCGRLHLQAELLDFFWHPLVLRSSLFSVRIFLRDESRMPTMVHIDHGTRSLRRFSKQFIKIITLFHHWIISEVYLPLHNTSNSRWWTAPWGKVLGKWEWERSDLKSISCWHSFPVEWQALTKFIPLMSQCLTVRSVNVALARRLPLVPPFWLLPKRKVSRITGWAIPPPIPSLRSCV